MRRVIIKLGGSTLENKDVIHQLAQDIVDAPSETGIAVVHGGGKEIKKELDLNGVESVFVHGQRFTDTKAMECVVKALSGTLNKEIVSIFRSHGVNACGISGIDGGLINTEKLLVDNQDIGFVGRITSVDTGILDTLFKGGLFPVIAPVSGGQKAELYNVNADNAAGAVAQALPADDLIYISDIPGVLIENQVTPLIKRGDIKRLISEGHIKGGMIPKIESAGDAVAEGVGRVHICDWKGPGTLTEQLRDNPGSGTLICQ